MSSNGNGTGEDGAGEQGRGKGFKKRMGRKKWKQRFVNLEGRRLKERGREWEKKN